MPICDAGRAPARPKDAGAALLGPRRPPPHCSIGASCGILARLRTSDFDYDLDPRLIAQAPCTPRDQARLLCHAIGMNRTVHARVADLASLLEPGDLVVVNDTRVRRARLLGRRASGARVEFLLLEQLPDGAWRAMVRPAARVKPGESIALDASDHCARAIARELDAAGGGAVWRVEIEGPTGARAKLEDLERWGRMPLPPYIQRALDDTRSAQDEDSYQTMFAAKLGAIAAPTAGLHFTPALSSALTERSIELEHVTLHVGAGTFRSVEVESIEQHEMHAESFELSPSCEQAIARCRSRRGRVVAVGTTTARVLEHCASDAGAVRAGAGVTRLFLTPGAPFRVVDALFTNFHLPRSTLLMLVSAFAGRERVLDLYAQAMRAGYRFYSYGDAMLLTDRRSPL